MISITGNYTVKQVERLANKIFASVAENKIQRERNDVVAVPVSHVEIPKPINQVHYMVGAHAYSFRDDRKTGLLLLNNMLGGMGMSSILNLSIREKYGIAYTIESNYTMFSDSGLFSIYLGTDEEKIEKAKKLVFRELNKFCEKEMSAVQLQKAKRKFIGQIALSEENRMSMIIAAAKNVMDYNQIIELDVIIDKIKAISTTELLETSREILDPARMTSLSFVPES